MLYAIVAQDVPNSLVLRKQHRPAHLARLQQLLDEGRLVLAGPRPAIDSPEPGAAGFVGSLIVAQFPDLTTARAWANADPFVAAGVYAQVDVSPFVQALP